MEEAHCIYILLPIIYLLQTVWAEARWYNMIIMAVVAVVKQ